MSDRAAWGTLASSLTALEARVRRGAGASKSESSVRGDGVWRAYLRAVLLEDAMREAATPVDAPAPATVQRLVHRLADGIEEDEPGWLALTAVHRVARGARVLQTHSVNVTILAVAMARALGLSRDDQAQVGLAAFVHDVRRQRDVGRHDIDTAAWLLEWAPVEVAVRVAAVASGHRVTGKPGTVRAGSRVLDLTTRIVQIADTYDVLCGRDGVVGSPDLVLAFMLQGTGERFDRGLLKIFARVVGVYPPGTAVRLNDGAIAVVVRPNRRQDGLDRPTVRIVVAPDGTAVTPPELVDLAMSRGEVVETVDPSTHGIDAATLARGN